MVINPPFNEQELKTLNISELDIIYSELDLEQQLQFKKDFPIISKKIHNYIVRCGNKLARENGYARGTKQAIKELGL
jgi:hypothetical protein